MITRKISFKDTASGFQIRWSGLDVTITLLSMPFLHNHLLTGEWVKKWIERELDPSLMKKDSQQSDKQFGQGLLI